MRVSFTGHRPEKIARWSEDPKGVEADIRRKVAARILELVGEGATEFASGMAPGFDLWAADELLRLRQEGLVGEDVRLTLLIPYPHFERSFEPSVRELYQSIVVRANGIFFVGDQFSQGCFQRRNMALVERADVVVAYYSDGTKGGTRYTLKLALKKGVRVENLCHDGELF